MQELLAPASPTDLNSVHQLIDNVPSELKSLDVWVLLQGNLDEMEPVITGRDGDPAYVDQPDTWLGFNEAVEMLAGSGDCQLGFAISDDHDYTAIEWWAIVKPDGELSPTYRADWIRFLNSYTERTDDQHLLSIVKGRPPVQELEEEDPDYELKSAMIPVITSDAGFVPVTGEVVPDLATIRDLSVTAGRLLNGLAQDPLLKTEAIGASWQTTEGWASRKFIELFGDELRYCVEEDAWYCWDGRRWQRDDVDHVYNDYWSNRFLQGELKAFANLVPDIVPGKQEDINDPAVQARLEDARQAQVRERGTAMGELPDIADTHKLQKPGKTARQLFRVFINSLDNHNRCRNVLALAAKQVKVLSGDFDARPDELNLSNGILELRSGELKPHDPAAMHSRMVDIDYDPDVRCPRFMSFLQEVCGTADGKRRPEIEAFVQLALGYSCLGTVEAQVFFILVGDAGCGKSTLIEFIQEEILGDYGTQVSKALATRTWNADENRFQKVNLKGARLVLIPETDAGSVLNAATVKEITTKRKLSAEVKHAADISFDATHTLWLCSNHLPLITDNDAGTFRRMRPIPFEHKIPVEKQDRQLMDKLREERAGVLAWLVRGAMSYASLPKALDAMPAASQTMTDNYQVDSDPLAEWTQAYVTVHEEGSFMNGFVYSADVYAHYREWAEIQGIEPKKKQTVSKYLNTAMKLRDRYSRGPNGNDNGWPGVTIKRATHPNQRAVYERLSRNIA
jgi:P4 family phage/plasmid primase-like protien